MMKTKKKGTHILPKKSITEPRDPRTNVKEMTEKTISDTKRRVKGVASDMKTPIGVGDSKRNETTYMKVQATTHQETTSFILVKKPRKDSVTAKIKEMTKQKNNH